MNDTSLHRRNVRLAAAYSATGPSSEILGQGIHGNFDPVASDLIFEEARRKLEAKAPETTSSPETFRRAATFEMVWPSREEIEETVAYTTGKDTPVVAAARKAQVDYLLSLDGAQLVGVSSMVQGSSLTNFVVRDLMKEIRTREE